MAENTRRTTRRRSRLAILGLAVPVIFVITYLLAWWDAYRLSVTYLKDADTSYQEGRYLDALLGYEVFDQAHKQYVNYGGYIQVQRIWKSSYAFPEPGEVERANQRADEIVYERLTLEEAEQFVQENIGRYNPYMGLIYLRLGELYEAEGEFLDAQDIYESIPDLFPDDNNLIERARTDLKNLLAQQTG